MSAQVMKFHYDNNYKNILKYISCSHNSRLAQTAAMRALKRVDYSRAPRQRAGRMRSAAQQSSKRRFWKQA